MIETSFTRSSATPSPSPVRGTVPAGAGHRKATQFFLPEVRDEAFGPFGGKSAATPDAHRELSDGDDSSWSVNRMPPGSGWDETPAPSRKRSEERRVGKECRSRWSPY